MGLAVGILIPVIRYVRSIVAAGSDVAPASDAARTELGWWSILVVPLAMVLGFVVICVCVLILNALLELMEYLAYVLRRCPKCGRRRWSWGFTRGFGL